MVDIKTNIESGWNFDNSYTGLPEIFFSRQYPTSVPSPGLAVLNHSLAASLGLNIDQLRSDEGSAVFAGNKVPHGASPIAQAYAGHQFGYFTMLGDGRAVLLGEQITPEGERFDIQLKGAGRTPYSRRGDGKAALGPMLREYIISEAMYALEIPTTRSLAVATTGERIIRETDLPGAVLTRVAASHIRVGTFQFASEWGSEEELRELADYTIARHYPGIHDEEDKYLTFLREVINRQAALIAKWQLVGFIHGVMNTDNMTIIGETIDYGPCAFMDTYDPKTVFSSIDAQGRYEYGNQPYMAAWNLSRFAETLLPLLHENEDRAVEIAQNEISGFSDIYKEHWISGMRAKLGILNEEDGDESLVIQLLDIMEKNKVDFTNTFLALTFDKIQQSPLLENEAFRKWQEAWHARLGRQQESMEMSKELMRNTNPQVIPRNHRVEEALEAAVNGDYGVMKKLLDALTDPFGHSPEKQEYTIPPGPSSCKYRTFCGT